VYELAASLPDGLQGEERSAGREASLFFKLALRRVERIFARFYRPLRNGPGTGISVPPVGTAGVGE
jgi:hypothetical protein